MYEQPSSPQQHQQGFTPALTLAPQPLALYQQDLATYAQFANNQHRHNNITGRHPSTNIGSSADGVVPTRSSNLCSVHQLHGTHDGFSTTGGGKSARPGATNSATVGAHPAPTSCSSTIGATSTSTDATSTYAASECCASNRWLVHTNSRCDEKSIRLESKRANIHVLYALP